MKSGLKNYTPSSTIVSKDFWSINYNTILNLVIMSDITEYTFHGYHHLLSKYALPLNEITVSVPGDNLLHLNYLLLIN